MAFLKPRSGYECSFTFKPLRCCKCSHIVREAHTTNCCKRNFCKNCILKVQRNTFCSACSKPQSGHRPNKDLNEVLQNFKVNCTNKCSWKGYLKDHDSHLNIASEDSKWLEGCEKIIVQCIFCRKEADERAALLKLLQGTLEPSDWEVVYDSTKEVCHKWKDVGDELKVDYISLKSIEERCKNIPEDCYRELLQKWIQSKGDANWTKLIKAFRNRTVEFKYLSDRLEKSKTLLLIILIVYNVIMYIIIII